MKGLRALTCSCCAEPGPFRLRVRSTVGSSVPPLQPPKVVSCSSSGCKLSKGAQAKQRGFFRAPHLKSPHGDRGCSAALPSRRKPRMVRLPGLQLHGLSLKDREQKKAQGLSAIAYSLIVLNHFYIY